LHDLHVVVVSESCGEILKRSRWQQRISLAELPVDIRSTLLKCSRNRTSVDNRWLGRFLFRRRFSSHFFIDGWELIGFQAESAVRRLRKIITAGISVLPNQMQDVIVIWCEMGPSYFVGSFFRRWRWSTGVSSVQPGEDARPPTACWNSTGEAVSIEPRSTCVADHAFKYQGTLIPKAAPSASAPADCAKNSDTSAAPPSWR